MSSPKPAIRRRRWPLFVPFGLLIVLAAGWTGVWYYAVGKAEQSLAGWRAREAKSGRIYACASETISGFPFRIELRCNGPSAELRGKGASVLLKSADLVVLAQVYDPTLLISEIKSPLTIADPGQPPAYVANWSLAQSSVRGTPRAPQRGSLVFDNLTVQQPGSNGTSYGAKRLELHGRMAGGSVNDNPVIELGVRTTAAIAAEIHPIMATPIDLELSALVRGLADFAPKPWPVRLRELQARGGKIEITNARLQQGETIAVGSGTLGLTENGNLDGQLQLTVVGIEHVLKQLDLEAVVSQGRVGSAIDKLDRLVPGLGNIARKNVAPGIMAGLDVIGKRTTLEGKPALSVPLRFVDGRIMLGPLPVGRAPSLF
jgi:hypothetical protein